MALRDFLLGTPAQTEQVQRFNPEQQQAFSQILQQALGGLQDPSAGFAPIAEQARTQFEQQTIPSIAERFTAMGGQGSSAFKQQLGQAGAGLEQGLAAQQAQFGQQQQGFLQNLLGQGLTPQFDTIQQSARPGFLETGIAQPFMQGFAQALPGLTTGGASSLASLGSQGVQKLLPMLLQLLGGGAQQQARSQQPAAGGAPTYQPAQSKTFNNLRLLTGGF